MLIFAVGKRKIFWTVVARQVSEGYLANIAVAARFPTHQALLWYIELAIM